jgi:hypothetical protein
MLGDLQLTVAQLMSLSIGQVVPFQMNEQVPLVVDGVKVVSGRSGTRHGRHAVKVDVSSPVNLQGLKADFVPLLQGLTGVEAASAEPASGAASPVTEGQTLVDETNFQNNLDRASHEHQPPQ